MTLTRFEGFHNVPRTLCVAVVIAGMTLGTLSPPLTTQAQDSGTGAKAFDDIDGVSFVDDRAFVLRAEKQVNRMIRDETETLCRDLYERLERALCEIDLPEASTQQRDLPKWCSVTASRQKRYWI